MHKSIVSTRRSIQSGTAYKIRFNLILLGLKNWTAKTHSRHPVNIHLKQPLKLEPIIGSLKTDYNIPRAYLLNRSPVPAMVLKTNRSSLLWFLKAIDQACDVTS